jgi:cytochrome c
VIGVMLLLLATLQGAPKPAIVPRPHDPWVFRSVLDERPRIVTIALNDDMWIAYDTTTCSLYRAWKGGVEFEGAVFTSEHGPQPRTQGPLYVEGYDLAKGGSVWDVTYQRGPEMLREPVRAVWRGYRVDGRSKVTLLYDISLPDGGTVRVEESPEFVRPMDRFNEEQIENIGVPSTHPGLVRVFHVIDPPDGHEKKSRP